MPSPIIKPINDQNMWKIVTPKNTSFTILFINIKKRKWYYLYQVVILYDGFVFDVSIK